jgi:hypothetical protein
VVFTITVCFKVTVGAVKRPDLEIAPALADHSTAVLLASLTVAVNCSVLPETTVVLDGETVTATLAVVGTTVTWAVASALASATLVVFTITVCDVVTEGAVKRPELEMVPALADHFTAVLLVSLTMAVNC